MPESSSDWTGKMGMGICVCGAIILLKSSVIGIFIAAGAGAAATAYYTNKGEKKKAEIIG